MRWPLFALPLGLFCLSSVGFGFGLGAWSSPPLQVKDITLKVGIVQRFGDQDRDQLSLSGTANDPLTFTLVDLEGKTLTLEGKQATITINRQGLASPTLQEYLVLSDHATFETAEDNAKQWQAKGIEVEVTQPERWQVWAKRSTYGSAGVRRWLLASLRSQGYDFPYLASRMVRAKPQAVLVLNGQNYATNNLTVSARKQQVQVTEGQQKPQLYPGSLILQPNAYGHYTLVNQVPLEAYLRGVVPHEIGHNAPPNAVRAQTIIARTYALRNLRRFAADNYELCATTHCQVYYGLKDANPEADKAIAATQGQVLTYNNELVDALYSSTTGGVTAKFSDVWNGADRPYLKALIDSPQKVWDLAQNSLDTESAFRKFMSLQEGFNETGRKVFRWRYTATLKQLTQDLKEYLAKRKHPLANLTTIGNIEVTRRSPSGRVLLLTVETDQGPVELAKNEARSAFGPPRSTLFYLEPSYDNQKQLLGFTFVGGGLGHGVGMSQFGSYRLAQLGWSAEKILEFYYPGTKIQSLNSHLIFWQDSP